MALQKAMKDHNAPLPPAEQTQIRITINTGEVSLDEGDVYGEAVNIAARIEGIAEPNEVYFTESTYLAMNKSEVPSAEIGYRSLRGIADPIRVYKVLFERPSTILAGATPAKDAATAVATAQALAPAEAGAGWIIRARSLPRRGSALAIDVLLTLLVTGIPAGDEGLFWVLFLLYTGLSVGNSGTTLGKRLLGLRVVTRSGERPGWGKSFVRALGYVVSILPLGAGFLWAAWDPAQEAFHDKIAETRVERTKRGK